MLAKRGFPGWIVLLSIIFNLLRYTETGPASAEESEIEDLKLKVANAKARLDAIEHEHTVQLRRGVDELIDRLDDLEKQLAQTVTWHSSFSKQELYVLRQRIEDSYRYGRSTKALLSTMQTKAEQAVDYEGDVVNKKLSTLQLHANGAKGAMDYGAEIIEYIKNTMRYTHPQCKSQDTNLKRLFRRLEILEGWEDNRSNECACVNVELWKSQHRRKYTPYSNGYQRV